MLNFSRTFLQSLAWPKSIIQMFWVVVVGPRSKDLEPEQMKRTTRERALATFSCLSLLLGFAAPVWIYTLLLQTLPDSAWIPATILVLAWLLATLSVTVSTLYKRNGKAHFLQNLRIVIGWTIIPFFSMGVVFTSGFILLLSLIA